MSATVDDMILAANTINVNQTFIATIYLYFFFQLHFIYLVSSNWKLWIDVFMLAGEIASSNACEKVRA